jgi:hypothetical protein
MMPRLTVLPCVLALTLGALPAEAVTVSACTELASVHSIAEPWEANTRTFAKGEIRLVVLDTIEPAVASFYLVILHPPRDELGSPICSMVLAADGLGFSSMNLGPATAAYDPARGLSVSLPVGVYIADTAGFDEGTLSVTINQATGLVTAVVE